MMEWITKHKFGINGKIFNDRRKQNKKAGQPLEHLTAGEYLSRFRKKDQD